jgi:hypothetical protein
VSSLIFTTDWFSGEGSLELIKSLLLGGAPNKQNIFYEKIVKKIADLGEVLMKHW